MVCVFVDMSWLWICLLVVRCGFVDGRIQAGWAVFLTFTIVFKAHLTAVYPHASVNICPVKYHL